MFHGLPSSTIVEFHPIVLAIFNFASVLQSLSEEFSKIVIIGRVLKAKVPNVAQIFVELLCHYIQLLMNRTVGQIGGATYQDIHHRDL